MLVSDVHEALKYAEATANMVIDFRYSVHKKTIVEIEKEAREVMHRSVGMVDCLRTLLEKAEQEEMRM